MEDIIMRVLGNRASEGEEASLRAWRRQSLANEQYYRDLVRMLKESKAAAWEEVEGGEPPSTERLMARAEASGRSDRPSATGTRPRGWPRGRAGRLAVGIFTLAAGVAGVALGLGLRASGSSAGYPLGTGEIITGASETTTVKLGDGSTVRLAPNSRLLISEDSDVREVWLDGRAFFAVREVDGVPFRIRSHAGDAVVLGTRFELQASEDRLRVLVVEGAVELSDREVAEDAIEVGASQIGQVAPASSPMREMVDATAVQRELRWLGDFLVFEGTPLRDVATELSRHFDRPVEILDSRLESETVQALFFEESFEEVVEVLCRALAARCSVQPSGAVIGP